jgi:hypothetical protein
MRKLRLFLLLMIFAMLLGGCGKEEITEGETVVYHLNKDGTSIVPVAYEITGDSPEVRVEEFLAKLEEVPESVDPDSDVHRLPSLAGYGIHPRQCGG